MASVTAGNASAMQVTSGTTVTAQQTSAHARPGMVGSAANGAIASAAGASAQSQEPSGRHARSARPAPMLAAARGDGPSASLPAGPGLLAASQPSGPASLPPHLHTSHPSRLAGEQNSY